MGNFYNCSDGVIFPMSSGTFLDTISAFNVRDNTKNKRSTPHVVISHLQLMLTGHQYVSRQRLFARHVCPGTYSGTFTSFKLDPFSLSWLAMLFSYVALRLPRGPVPFTL